MWAGSTSETSFTDKGLQSGQTYCYAVAAVSACLDGSEVASPPSQSVCVATESKGGGNHGNGKN